MIHMWTFVGESEEDCLKKINEAIPDDKVINVIPTGSTTHEGYDEYDVWTDYYMTVIYKD